MMRHSEVMRSARASESHITRGPSLLSRELLELCSSLAMVITSTWGIMIIRGYF